MKILRYWSANKLQTGWYNDGLVGPIEGDIFTEFRRLEAKLPLDKVKLAAPVNPGKIICIGRNYGAHAAEHGVEVPQIPLLFLKPPSSVIGTEENIILPPQSRQVEHEAELAVIIGKAGRWIDTEDVSDYILGYTIANDVTARDLQRMDGQWTRAKGFDTFCPLGPWIDTELNPVDSLITCKVNGEVRQMGTTRDMIFPVSHLITFISSVMTLLPGDVVLTGTPAGVGVINSGDTIEIEIEGLGVLKNLVTVDR